MKLYTSQFRHAVISTLGAALLLTTLSCNISDPLAITSDDARCGDGRLNPGETCDGDCPTCDDGDPCTEDAVGGAPQTCDVVCSNTLIENCGEAVCGNGTVEPGETCDGDCPASCDDGDDCTTDASVGSASACNVECVNATIPGCMTNLCGDGVVDSGEACDGDCPTSCQDGDPCTEDTLTGAPQTCNVVCSNTPIEDCGDPVCGNGTIEAGETCDGDCPASCDDGDACTTNTTTGAAAQCDIACATAPVVACVGGDGCCPSGCTFDMDSDCPCTPTTCAAAGQTCGPPLDDGCGQMLDCGVCGTNETCLDTQCQASGGVGGTCPAGCPTGGCLSDDYSGYPPGGYCTALCTNGDTECPMGTHCGSASLCFQTCTASSECRAPYYECYDNDGDGRSECAPVGTGGGAIGDPCDNTSDCAGGQGAKCIPEYVPTNNWADGYCSRKCTNNLDCPTGTSCYGDSCVADCIGPADCRGAGYNCFDGNSDGRRECLPWLGQSVVGDPCVANSDCVGGELDIWGICRQPYTDSNGDLKVPNGYCTSQCGPGQGTCAPGVVCHDFDGTGSFYGCLIPCSAQGTCPLAGQECLTTTSGLLCL